MKKITLLTIVYYAVIADVSFAYFGTAMEWQAFSITPDNRIYTLTPTASGPISSISGSGSGLSRSYVLKVGNQPIEFILSPYILHEEKGANAIDVSGLSKGDVVDVKAAGGGKPIVLELFLTRDGVKREVINYLTSAKRYRDALAAAPRLADDNFKTGSMILKIGVAVQLLAWGIWRLLKRRRA